MKKFNYSSHYYQAQGFVVLTSLLIISVVALVIALSSVLLGINEVDDALSFKKSQELLIIAQACVEESLLRLRDNDAWDPEGEEISLPGLTGICSVEVTASNSERQLEITSTITGSPQYDKKIEVEAKVVGHSVNLISREETE
jgi:hypothetical protein